MWSQAVSGAPVLEDDQDQWPIPQDQLPVSSTDTADGYMTGAYVDPQVAFTYYPDQASGTPSTYTEFDAPFAVAHAGNMMGASSQVPHPETQYVALNQTQWCHPSSSGSPPLTATSSPTNDAASLATADLPSQFSSSFHLPTPLIRPVGSVWYPDWVTVEQTPVYAQQAPSNPSAGPADPQRPVHDLCALTSLPNQAATLDGEIFSPTESFAVLSSPVLKPNRSNDKALPAQPDNELIKSEEAELGMGPGRTHAFYEMKALADGLYHCPYRKDPDPKVRCQHEPTKLKCNYDKYIDSHLKPYRCKQSGCETLRFSSTACRLRHEREAHGSHGHGDKPYRCKFADCDRSRPDRGFPRQWNRRDHMRRVHDYDELTDNVNPEMALTDSIGTDLTREETTAEVPAAPKSRKRAASDSGSSSAQPAKQRKVASARAVARSEERKVSAPVTDVDETKLVASPSHAMQPHNTWAAGDSTELFRDRLLQLAMNMKGPEDVSSVCQEVNFWHAYTQAPHG